jgi:archaeosine synthase
MAEFRVGRGHDGPARVGEYILGSTTYSTPLLMSSFASSDSILAYGTLGRDEPLSEAPMLVSLPFVNQLDELPLSEIREHDTIILPSLISLAKIRPDASDLVLSYQQEILSRYTSRINPTRTIIRIPSETNPVTITKLAHLGFHGAVFSFNGQLGPQDFGAITLRSRLPLFMVALAVGRIEPGLIPLLYYTGFDIIDIGYAEASAADAMRLWKNGTERIELGKERRYCSCPSCAKLETAKPEDLQDILLEHNLGIYKSIISESKDAMRSGRLRWLVESSTHNSPAHASLVRLVNRELYAFIEEFSPTTGPDALPVIGSESYNAPVVRRFRDFVATRYSAPIHKPIILLLPCSAKKPYSDSKSHRRFAAVIEAAMSGMESRVAEVILTSPLGLVPRELERIYPAGQYDIPVTGDWDTEEIEIGANALVTHLKKFSASSVVIAHVSGGYLDIVRSAEARIEQSIIYTTHEGRATSRESLNALEEAFTEMREILSISQGPPTELEEIVSATADYQFGRGAGKVLVPEHARLKGKPYKLILCSIDGKQVCSYVADSGTLSLTLAGGKRLAPLNRYWVRLDVPKIKGGSIFAVGVKQADHAIRPGDEVIIINELGDVIAVGRSEMSGREMCELNRGRAVTVRHKKE